MGSRDKPWMKFYPDDWRGEPRLRLVSRCARSLWIDLLCMMHNQTDQRGMLIIDGEPVPARHLAAILGDSESDIAGWISELERAGVCVQKDGAICSRRMIKEGDVSEVKARAGEASGKARKGKSRGKYGKKSEGSEIEQNRTDGEQSERTKREHALAYGSLEYGSSKRGVQRGDVDRVVSRYLGHHPKRKVSDKERALVRARLEDGYTADDLIEAIDGNMASAWHQGKNDRGKAYDKLNLILRDASHVDEFREMKKPRRDPSELPKLTMPEWARNV